MSEAFFWGAVGGLALVLGALGALYFSIDRRVLGAIMAFGAGVLISAVAFELVEEAFETADGGGVAAGLFFGALVFFAGDAVIDRYGGDARKSASGKQSEGGGMAIVLGSVLDGVPESIVLGIGLSAGDGISVPFVVAVFLSNLPEGLGATSGLVASGWSRSKVLLLWGAVALVSALSSAIGYSAFDGAAPSTIAFVLAFAGGAILTMLADTMMPEAFEHGGKLVGLCTTAGFALAFALHAID